MLRMPGSFNEYDTFEYRAEICEIFAWWPRRCWITNRWMWLAHVIRGEATWYGPGTPVVEKRYYNSAEYLMYKLKQ
jgi:hypothetical protein